MLTADDLAGIARAAGADDGEQGPELVNLASPSRVYTDDETRDILRRYAAGTKAATQALTIEPDPRLDEIVSLLKQLVQAVERKDFLGRDMGLPVRIVAAGGGSSGSTCECQRGSNPIPQPRPVL